MSDSHWKSWVSIAKSSRRPISIPPHLFSACPVLWSPRKLVQNIDCTFVLELYLIRICLCSFGFWADENVKGARFTHKASLLLAPAHSASKRQKQTWYVLVLFSHSGVFHCNIFYFSTFCVHVLRQTFPTSFSMVVIVQDRFRNIAFVFLVMNRGLCDWQYQRELSKECFLSNINAL